MTLIAALISLGIEFIQLVPRTGILARAKYTFDWYDVIATVLSICIGYFIACIVNRNIDKQKVKL